VTEPSALKELADLIDRATGVLLCGQGEKGNALAPLSLESQKSIVIALRAVPAQEPVAWRWRHKDLTCSGNSRAWNYAASDLSPNGVIETEPLYAAPVPPADLFAECAEIALEHVGAVDTSPGTNGESYDEACRDIARAIELRASNRKTMDAIADRELRTASLSLD